MESNKVKELKDDALLNVKVNKTYYMMCKAALYTVFKVLYDSSGNPDFFVKKIVTKEYKEMDKQIKKDIENGIAMDPVEMNILSQKEMENNAYAPEISDAEADADNERKIDLEKAKPKPKPPSSKGSAK